MKVYTLETDDNIFAIQEIVGIYTSLNKAKEACCLFMQQHLQSSFKFTAHYSGYTLIIDDPMEVYFRVEEFELDGI